MSNYTKIAFKILLKS